MTGLIKICGVKTPEAIAAAFAAGATHIGFNFVAASPRYVTADEAAGLTRTAPDTLIRVAVTADATDDALAQIVRVARPNALQLHGAEDPQRTAHVSARFGLPVIKAIGLSGPEDIRMARSYQTTADFLLFDAKPPKAGAATPTGGHGKTFDWQILRGQTFSKPWFLSGGLTPANVDAAIRVVQPPGVDVASGVESARGIKDDGLITQFCAAAVRAYAAEAVA
jgi:phosphoribosylanthranilate isomerase